MGETCRVYELGGGILISHKPYRAIKLTENTYWVGAVDWKIRDFHGYSTNRGSTYNAYLIMKDEPVLIDTVKAPFLRELLSRVESVIEPEKIRYIVSNHSEMDHSGSLPDIAKIIRPDKVFASRNGVAALNDHFDLDCEVEAVSDGETVQLGGASLTFLETKMLHWPDSMITYFPEERILFSQDGFGMHLAGEKLFADEVPRSVLEEEAARYYANILLPFSSLIKKLIDRLGELNLDISLLAPDHGPLYRRPEDIQWIIGKYLEWSEQRPSARATILFDTMWGSTEMMARMIGEGLSESGIPFKLFPLSANHRSDVAADVLKSGALVVGSPTLNNGIFPSVSDVLTYLKGLKPRNLIGAAFGSYGWSGEAPKQIADILEKMGVELIAEPFKVRYVPKEEDLIKCRELGMRLGSRIKEVAENGGV